MVSTYLTDIIILLVAAVIAVPLFQAVRLGAVPGFLVAGVIVGPSVLSLIDNVGEISYLSEIGVVLLLFVIGTELKPSRLWLMRRLVFGLGTFQVLFTGAFIALLLHFVFDIRPRAATLIGPAMALSSTAFVLQLLTEKKALSSEYGRTSFAVLLLQDLAVVPLLALIPLLAMPELTVGKDIGLALVESLLILGLVILAGRFFLHPILHRVVLSGSSEVFTSTAVLIVLGTALITEHIGLSMAMGAFLAGLLLSDSAYRHQVMAEIKPFRGLLLGLFFMSMGMSLDVAYFIEQPLMWLGLVAGLIAIKVMMLWPMAYLFLRDFNKSMAVALILGQSGEFALVLFALAFQSELITQVLFQQLLLIVLLSMLATPALARLADQLCSPGSRKSPEPEEIPESAPIVIAGFGRVGHRIGEILSIAKQPFVALDLDATLVQRQRNNGHPVFYGDVRQPEVLTAAGASTAQCIIVTLDDAEASKQVVSSLRQAYPEMSIIARGNSLEQCRELRSLGASAVISENVEASLELASIALTEAGIDKVLKDNILVEFRRTYRRQIDEVATEEK